MSKKLALFLSFLKIGAFTFGGGYAMIALLENEFVGNRKWITKDEFLDMTAIAESTPGPIAINSATYIGFKTDGFLGALCATIGVCLPSFVIIYIISLFLEAFKSITFIASAFQGIRVCVVYLILAAGVRMFKGMKKIWFHYFIAGAVILAFILLYLFDISFSAIFYVIICGIAGLIFYSLFNVGKEAKK